MRRAAVLFGFLALLAIPAAGQNQENAIHVMSKVEFNLFIRGLSTDLPRWRASISKVDVGSLGVSFQEGKEIEQMRDTCLQFTDTLQQDVQQLSAKATLKNQVVAMSLLDNLEESTVEFGESLISAHTDQPQDFPNLKQWSNDILQLEKDMSKTGVRLFGHLVALADRIDSTVDLDNLSR